jgi:hypothetical protein
MIDFSLAETVKLCPDVGRSLGALTLVAADGLEPLHGNRRP